MSRQETVGRLAQVCEGWIYSACLIFGQELDEQVRSRFNYSYSVYQVECSRNLQFRIGAQMEAIFERMVDRTRSRLDIPVLRTLSGVQHTTTTPDRTKGWSSADPASEPK